MNKIYKNFYLIGTFVLLFGVILACSEEEPINVPPTFKLNQVDNIMRTAATFSGSVSGDLSSIREYGFQYSTAEGFPANLTTEVEVGDSVKGKDLLATVRNLQPNTRYYYRLYATTGATTIYSNNEYFQTTASSEPLFSTVVVDSIGENMARFKCTIEDIGDEYLIEYGVGYKTATDKTYIPIPSDSIIPASIAGAENTYFVEVNGLSPATKYSFRPYAKNSTSADGSTGSREGYGDIVERQTESLLSADVTTSEIADGHIGINSIEVSGTLNSATGSNGIINVCGFCWSENNALPVITDDTLSLDPVRVGEPFYATIKDLKPKTSYYVRAYATNTVNGVERVGYGEVYLVNTGGLIAPRIEIDVEENEYGYNENFVKTTASSVRVKATITNYDDNALVEKGLIWSETSGGVTLQQAKEDKTILSLDLNTGGKTIDGTIQNLKMNHRYWVKAYAVYQAEGLEEIGYTDAFEAWTDNFSRPNLASVQVDEVTRNSATLTGGMYSEGNGTITERGFCMTKYEDAYDPTLTTKGVTILKSDDTFTKQLTGLRYDTRYQLRSYTISTLAEVVDTAYSNIHTFTTSRLVEPEFKDMELTRSNDTIKISTGLVSVGDGDIVERGFSWRRDTIWDSFAWGNSEHIKATGDNEQFSAAITDLEYETHYQFTAYTKNLVDGDTVVFHRGGWHTMWSGSMQLSDFSIEHVDASLNSITVKSGFGKPGSVKIVEKGFIWIEDPDDGNWKYPRFEGDILDDPHHDGYTGYKAVIDGTDEDFSLEITGLEKATKYFISAYVKLMHAGKEYVLYAGSGRWSTEDYSMPYFNNVNVESDSIGFSTAVVKTSFNHVGNLPIVKKGFVVHYSDVTYEPSLTNKLIQVDVEGDEMITKLKDLKHDTRYTVRAFATCKVGDGEETTYSGNRNFSTNRPQGPSFNNLRNDSTAINALYFSCGIGEVKDGEVKEKGFVWIERPRDNHNWLNPTLEKRADINGDGYDDYDGHTAYQAVESDSLQSYNIAITGLKPSTTYYIRSYAKVQVEDVEYVYYSGSSGVSTRSLPVNIWFETTADSCAVSGTVTDLPAGVEEFGICFTSNRDERIEDIKTTFKAVKAEDFDENGSWTLGIADLESNHEYKVGFYFILNGEEIRLDGEWWFTTKRIPSINDNVSPGKQGDE